MEKITRSCPESFTVDKIGRIKSYTNKQQEIREELKKLTNGHCSYCDILFLVPEVAYTPQIEHFKPQSMFPNQRTIWYNLFISCPKCNSLKRGYPDKKPLKPDTNEFSSFEKWFEIDFEKYEIRPNKLLNSNDKKRARTTINWLKLNNYEKIPARKKEYKDYQEKTNKDIEHYSYRFFIRIMKDFDNNK